MRTAVETSNPYPPQDIWRVAPGFLQDFGPPQRAPSRPNEVGTVVREDLARSALCGHETAEREHDVFGGEWLGEVEMHGSGRETRE